MGILSKTGRIFYGIAIAGMGFLTIYYHDFPYMLVPPNHSRVPGIAVLAVVSGILLILAGACIVFEKRTRQVSLLLGAVLLLIFCFCFIPYEFITGSNYMHLGEWENAEKELALAGGAFVIAGCFSEENENTLFRLLGKLIPFGAIVFSITIISFGILHSGMDSLPHVLDLFCRRSVNWFGHGNYFEDQDWINGDPFGDNDFYLVYFPPHPQGNCLSRCGYGR